MGALLQNFVETETMKVFPNGQPRSNVIKLCLSVIYEFTNFRNKLVFVPGQPFQPSLRIAGKDAAYPSEAPRPFPQI
jgi:hypothetical protein